MRNLMRKFWLTIKLYRVINYFRSFQKFQNRQNRLQFSNSNKISLKFDSNDSSLLIDKTNNLQVLLYSIFIDLSITNQSFRQIIFDIFVNEIIFHKSIKSRQFFD